MSSFTLQLSLIVRNGWRLLHSVGEADLFDCSDVLLVLFEDLVVYFLGLGSSSHGNQSLMLLGCWRIWFLWSGLEVTVH